MKFKVRKTTSGWWFVQEVAVDTGQTKSDAITLCQLRNEGRLDCKQKVLEMAQEDYRKAKRSYSPEPRVNYLKDNVRDDS